MSCVLAALDAEVRGDVPEPVGEPLPDVRAELVTRVLDDGLAHPLAELLDRHLGARDADDAEVLGEQAAERQRVERRHDLSLREVPGGAEDRRARTAPAAAACGAPRAAGSRRRSRHSAAFAFRRPRPRDRRTGCGGRRSPWPRKTRPAGRRSARRASSASTGTGTAASTASCTVQRPSPESSTYPRICSRPGSACSARSRSSSSQLRTTDPCCQSAASCWRSSSKWVDRPGGARSPRRRPA